MSKIEKNKENSEGENENQNEEAKENENESLRFWLCVTAKCECARPGKVENNYHFISGKQVKNSTAIKQAETGFYSYVNYKDKLISIGWEKKLTSIYFKDGENEVTDIGCQLTGNWKASDIPFTYVCSIRENYAQRMANEAFAEGNRVGITLATTA